MNSIHDPRTQRHLRALAIAFTCVAGTGRWVKKQVTGQPPG